MAGGYPADRDRIFNFFFSHPDSLETLVEISKAEHRELACYFALVEAIGFIDMSLGIIFGAQMSLWGGSIVDLGTQKHRDKYLEGIANLNPGCLAMTELHHGTQTSVAFDRLTDVFVINTPNKEQQNGG